MQTEERVFLNRGESADDEDLAEDADDEADD